MKLVFLGAAHEVTGSCTLIKINGKYGLVDCGMEQGEDIFENQKLPVNPGDIDFVLLTHAHIDHSGNIPLLFKNGYKGLVYASEATCNLCSIMLKDSAHIQESEVEWKNRKNERAGRPMIEPVYTVEDAELAISHLRPVAYNQRIEVDEGVEINFVDAGHLLGSASIEVYLTEGEEERKVVFSGDIGNVDQPLIKNPNYIDEADYVIEESTYGDRVHKKPAEGNVQFLANCIQKVLDRGGNLVIPSFAIGRTQEILYFIREIKQKGLVKNHDDFKVYVDSPLANEATAIFLQCDNSCFDEETQKLLNEGINPIMSPGVTLSVDKEESMQINYNKEPKVIISASGMCEAGRIRHHLKYNLWREECMILFVGYQAFGTTGRLLVDGADKIKLFGDEIICRAEIARMEGKSGHADMNGLIDWITHFKEKPKMVFINHGENEVTDSYAKLLNEEYGFTTSAPYSGAEFDLISGEYTNRTIGIPVKKSNKSFKQTDKTLRDE